MKGRITNRNKLPKFNVLLTTAAQIEVDTDHNIRSIPFLQVIIDEAEVRENRNATQKINCKRIVGASSNPLHNGSAELYGIVGCLDPEAVRDVSSGSDSLLYVTSIKQLYEVNKVVNPYVLKNYQFDLD